MAKANKALVSRTYRKLLQINKQKAKTRVENGKVDERKYTEYRQRKEYISLPLERERNTSGI